MWLDFGLVVEVLQLLRAEVRHADGLELSVIAVVFQDTPGVNVRSQVGNRFAIRIQRPRTLTIRLKDCDVSAQLGFFAPTIRSSGTEKPC